jgi:hypothetical protein
MQKNIKYEKNAENVISNPAYKQLVGGVHNILGYAKYNKICKIC